MVGPLEPAIGVYSPTLHPQSSPDGAQKIRYENIRPSHLAQPPHNLPVQIGLRKVHALSIRGQRYLQQLYRYINVEMHLTNVAIQKHSDNYDE